MPTPNSPTVNVTPTLTPQQLAQLSMQIKQLAGEFGFADCGITDTDNETAGERLEQWLDLGYQANMDYMSKHGSKRYRAKELVPGTKRIICLRMDYLDPKLTTLSALQDGERAYIARYALGRDYHKLVRKRLAQLSKAIEALIGPFGHRVFVDSAPVLEKPLAQKAGLGWQGKHTLLINRKQGSWFVLGEIFVDLPLPIDEPYQKDHCSRCESCMNVCPTNAFPQPYVLDANRCIAYLTIEHRGSIAK
ncbi:tRNA epoxyqueuosine(34) reductase QueG, partial [Oceanospirillaceae bacterium]|nr:tRNA epoxyqueuosine(34) reductase QueG [Oceanospirillaceae bacterium]